MKEARKIEAAFEVIRIVASLAIAYVVALLVLYFVSDEPLKVIQQFVLGPFSSPRRIGSILNLAIPFTMCGLGMCFVYSVGKLNMLGDGIFMFSGCIVTFLGIRLGTLGLPSPVLWVILLLIGGLVGAACMYLPAWLDVKLGASVIVVSIMANTILSELSQYILQFQMRDPSTSYLASYPLDPSVSMPKFFTSSLKIQSGILVAIAFLILSVVLLHKTTLGYKMRMVGANAKMARAAGMSVASTIIIAQLLGGFLAGMGGAMEILSNYTRFQWTDTTGHGFDGLMVAVLAKKDPKYVPLTALLLAYIRIGSDVVNSSSSIPNEFVSVIQCIIILLVAAEMFLTKQRNKLICKAAEANLKQEAQSAA